MAEYFEEKYDYSVPLKVPHERTAGAESTGAAGGVERGEAGAEGIGEGQPTAQAPREIPIWEGTDVLASREVIEVGTEGEKVDMMTFRGSFEQDVPKFAEQDADMQAAVADEDDDAVETLMNERFLPPTAHVLFARQADSFLRRPGSDTCLRLQRSW